MICSGELLVHLQETIPEALNSVSPATIHCHYLHCMRTVDVYATGVKYGMEEFKEWVYKGHHQVIDVKVVIFFIAYIAANHYASLTLFWTLCRNI